ncbi:hypothetical protein [Hymenobacter sediminicola]|uniref:Uncharacterized protein n=1 Tax=Hymenobacter sediminicola TaxID=2761579 RepID=A0A7G7W887_9BACT|nr:hypothetical protein [Hymenobacter sediminicola]QNH62580.1 hypothetical protein H4317_01770 [Hymenobacter sediminicola]
MARSSLLLALAGSLLALTTQAQPAFKTKQAPAATPAVQPFTPAPATEAADVAAPAQDASKTADTQNRPEATKPAADAMPTEPAKPATRPGKQR